MLSVGFVRKVNLKEIDIYEVPGDRKCEDKCRSIAWHVFLFVACVLLSWYGYCDTEGGDIAETVSLPREMGRGCKQCQCSNSNYMSKHKGDQCL